MNFVLRLDNCLHRSTINTFVQSSRSTFNLAHVHYLTWCSCRTTSSTDIIIVISDSCDRPCLHDFHHSCTDAATDSQCLQCQLAKLSETTLAPYGCRELPIVDVSNPENQWICSRDLRQEAAMQRALEKSLVRAVNRSKENYKSFVRAYACVYDCTVHIHVRLVLRLVDPTIPADVSSTFPLRQTCSSCHQLVLCLDTLSSESSFFLSKSLTHSVTGSEVIGKWCWSSIDDCVWYNDINSDCRRRSDYIPKVSYNLFGRDTHTHILW